MRKNRMMAMMMAGAMAASLAACGSSSTPEATTAAAETTAAAADTTAAAEETTAAGAETTAAAADDDVKNASNVQPEIPEGATVFKLGMTTNEQDSFMIAAVKFAQDVQDKTDGKYAIELHPNGDLGGERDMLESMQMGTLDMGIVTSGPFVNFSSDMGVLDMPYLFENKEQAYAVLDGEVGRSLLDTLEGSGLKGLAYAERGFRDLTNNVRPIKTAEDVKGLKIRVMENEVYQKAFDALGVNATPMAWADALTALQRAPLMVRRTRSTLSTPTSSGSPRSTQPSMVTATPLRSSPCLSISSTSLTPIPSRYSLMQHRMPQSMRESG